MTQTVKPPVWFWIIGAFALIWNLLGVMAYFMQVTMSAADFAALPQIEQDLFSSQPFWLTAAFPVAVFSGFAGGILLLMRKRLAVRMFFLSLIAVLIQFFGHFMLDKYLEYMSSQSWIMPVSIPILAIAFLLFTRWVNKKGYLG